MLTSDFRLDVEIWPFRACAMHPAIIIGTVRSLWTWLWGRYHVPQNAFLVGQIFDSESEVPRFNALAGMILSTNSAINDLSVKTRFFGLHFRCGKYWCIFNHFYAIRPESYRIRWNYAEVRAITPFKVIQGHRVRYRSKAHMRLSISH